MSLAGTDSVRQLAKQKHGELPHRIRIKLAFAMVACPELERSLNVTKALIRHKYVEQYLETRVLQVRRDRNE